MSEAQKERSPEAGVRWHPYADIFPWIEGAAFDELKADIAKNGVLEPIVFIDGAILDGRNRYMAARALGIEYPRVEYQGDDPLSFVLAKNLSRRHLTDRQRADVAAKLARLPKGANQHTPIGGPSVEEAAKMMDVPVKAVERSRTIQEHAAPELKAAYEAGKVSQSAAAEVAKLPKEDQAKVVADHAAAEKAKELREKRKAGKAAGHAENDAFREQIAAALPEQIKVREKAKAEAVAERKAKADPDALMAEIEELREANAALEAENADLKQRLKAFDEMKVEYEKGGFEEVIRGKDEVIRAQASRIERESQEKVSNLRSADWWKKKAIELGYSSREIIEING